MIDSFLTEKNQKIISLDNWSISISESENKNGIIIKLTETKINANSYYYLYKASKEKYYKICKLVINL